MTTTASSSKGKDWQNLKRSIFASRSGDVGAGAFKTLAFESRKEVQEPSVARSSDLDEKHSSLKRTDRRQNRIEDRGLVYLEDYWRPLSEVTHFFESGMIVYLRRQTLTGRNLTDELRR